MKLLNFNHELGKKYKRILFFILLIFASQAFSIEESETCFQTIKSGTVAEPVLFRSLDLAKNYTADNCSDFKNVTKNCVDECLKTHAPQDYCQSMCNAKFNTWRVDTSTSFKLYVLDFLSGDPSCPSCKGNCYPVIVQGDIICKDLPTDPPKHDDDVLADYEILMPGPTVKLKNSIPAIVNGTPTNTKECSQCKKGDPVNISTGLMWHQDSDFFLKGVSNFTNIIFQRTYIAQPILLKSGFGTHWFHNYQMKLYSIDINDQNGILWADENAGARIFFKNADGTYKNPPSFNGKLIELSDHFELIKESNIRYFFTKNNGVAPFGSLVKIQDTHLNSINLKYSSKGLLDYLEASLTGKVKFFYNDKKLITKITRVRDNLSYTYAYDDKDNLISVTDFEGKIQKYTYQISDVDFLNGLMTSFKDQMGRVVSFQYDVLGRVVKETEPGQKSRLFSYQFDQSGNRITLLQEIDGSTTKYTFDENYRLIKTNFPNGSEVNQEWNEKNSVTKIIDELGFETNFEYDQNQNLVSIIKPENENNFAITYDQFFNRPKEIVTPLNQSIQFQLHPNTGEILQVRRENLHLNYGYDNFGNLISTDNGLASYSEPTNSLGLKTIKFDSHNPENLFYDNRGRIIRRELQSGREINYTYDNYDRITLINDSVGPSTEFSYDIIGRLIQKDVFSVSNRETTKYLWDERDRLIKITDNLGRKTQFQYNAASSTSFVIDKPSAVIAPDGKTTVFKYDVMQRLVQKIEANGAITKYEYDSRGDLVKLTDAIGNYTLFTYDGNRRLIKKNVPTVITDNSGKSKSAREIVSYSYDDADHLITEEHQLDSADARKTTTTFIYDNLDRLISKKIIRTNSAGYILGEKTSSFTYEPILDAVLLKSADNEVANLSFEHEFLPPFKLTRSSTKASTPNNPLGLIEMDMTLDYDSTGELSLVRQVNGPSLVSYGHNRAGQILKARSGDFFGTNSPVFESVMSYDNFGRRISMTNSDGYKLALAYDELSRYSSLKWTKNSIPDVSERITYDLAGNIIDLKRESSKSVYGYDKVNQLISENSQIRSLSYRYDNAGNRIFDSHLGASSFISNAIVGTKISTKSFTTLAYDNEGRGNLVTLVNEEDKTQDDFSFNLDGKLETFQHSLDGRHDTLFANYSYDALGRRLVKQFHILKGTSEVTFSQSFGFLGNKNQILISKNGAGSFTIFVDGQYVDEHLGEFSATTAKSYIFDHLGSVLNADSISNREIFGAFGSKFFESKSADDLNENTSAVSYGYTGRELDLESGLYFNRARFYSPKMGRFLSPDPIGFRSLDINLYRYVKNSPLMMTDPFGLKEKNAFEDMSSNSSPEGVDLLINSYVNEAKYKVSDSDFVFNSAFLESHLDRNDMNYNGHDSFALRDAEHYLFSRKEIENGTPSSLVQLGALGYTPWKALEQFSGIYLLTEPNASSPSLQEAWYGLKGGLDGEICARKSK